MALSEKLVRSALATGAALAVAVLVYHPASPVGKSYWKAAAHHEQPGFNDITFTSVGVSALMLFGMAAMLEQLQAIDHVSFDIAVASDYRLGYLGLSIRVTAIIAFLLLPHVLMEGRCLWLFGIDRLYDFLGMIAMCLMHRQTKAACDAKKKKN